MSQSSKCEDKQTISRLVQMYLVSGLTNKSYNNTLKTYFQYKASQPRSATRCKDCVPKHSMDKEEEEEQQQQKRFLGLPIFNQGPLSENPTMESIVQTQMLNQEEQLPPVLNEVDGESVLVDINHKNSVSRWLDIVKNVVKTLCEPPKQFIESLRLRKDLGSAGQVATKVLDFLVSNISGMIDNLSPDDIARIVAIFSDLVAKITPVLHQARIQKAQRNGFAKELFVVKKGGLNFSIKEQEQKYVAHITEQLTALISNVTLWIKEYSENYQLAFDIIPIEIHKFIFSKISATEKWAQFISFLQKKKIIPLENKKHQQLENHPTTRRISPQKHSHVINDHVQENVVASYDFVSTNEKDGDHVHVSRSDNDDDNSVIVPTVPNVVNISKSSNKHQQVGSKIRAKSNFSVVPKSSSNSNKLTRQYALSNEKFHS